MVKEGCFCPTVLFYYKQVFSGGEELLTASTQGAIKLPDLDVIHLPLATAAGTPGRLNHVVVVGQDS